MLFRIEREYCEYKNRLNKLNLVTLENRRIFFDICLLHDIINGTTGMKYFVKFRTNSYPNRQNILFDPLFKTTDYGGLEDWKT